MEIFGPMTTAHPHMTAGESGAPIHMPLGAGFEELADPQRSGTYSAARGLMEYRDPLPQFNGPAQAFVAFALNRSESQAQPLARLWERSAPLSPIRPGGR